jgi:ribose transport system permease protein
VVTWTVFGIGGSGFLGSFNLYSVVQLAARDAVLGMAQAALLVVARVNLAVGSIGAICASLLGYLLVSASVPLPLALLSVCVVGVLASVLMGVVELRSGLSSFIVTLAFLSAYGGAALLATRADQYEITSSVLNRLGNGSLLASSICPLAVVALVCGVLVWLLYTRNGLGWRMLAVGSNEQAARVSGVNVPVVVLASYAISGLLCAVAAVMESAYQLNVNAGVGSDWLLPSFIAPILGGVALSGGDISVIGILLAALFYDSLQSGLTILNVPSYWLELAEGVVLLAAVVLDQMRRVRRRHTRYRPPDVATVLKEEAVA